MHKFEGSDKLFNNDMLRNIIYDDDGAYILYDMYSITKSNFGCTLIRFSDFYQHDFFLLRNAASWAILDRWNKIIEARRVYELDNTIGSLLTEQANHKRLQSSQDQLVRAINRDKYLNCIDRQKRFQWELDKYIKLAKKCQEKGYENELKRVTRN